jgi:hypothetical protein
MFCFVFSFKGSSANAEAPRDQRAVQKRLFPLKTTRDSTHPFGSFLLLFTLIVVFLFLSFIFKRQEFKNLANFPARYDQ